MRNYTKQANSALQYAKQVARKLGHNYVGSEHLLVGLRHEYTGVAGQILADCGLTEENIIEIIERKIAPDYQVATRDRDGISPRLENILDEAVYLAEAYGTKEAGTEHMLLAIVRDLDCMASRILATMHAPMQKLYMNLIQVLGSEPEELPGLAQRIADGGKLLEQYSTDLTQEAAEGKLDPVIGREDEISRVIQILSRRNKNNPCLIGEPGVGKSAIVEGLAQRIADGMVPDQLRDLRLLTLDLSSMVAGSKYRGEFEERMKGIIKEVQQDGRILLFMDEVHTLIGAGGAEGSLDAANILKPALARGTFQLIGATTISEYRKHIEKDAALERRFQPVMVEEPTAEQSIVILRGIASKYEEFHQLSITDEALVQSVMLSERYISDRNLPDKAIDVLDEACARVKLRGFKPVADKKQEDDWKRLQVLSDRREQALLAGNVPEASVIQKEYEALRLELEKAAPKKKRVRKNVVVNENDIADVVSQWTKVPVSKLKEKESARLLKLESILHKRVIGQDEAVSAVAKAVKRGRVGMKDPKRPIGSFLFLGPTGVGKTELSKALAEALFQTEDAMIRVDMSEYMESHSVSKMIGSPPGYVGHDEGGQLSEMVRRNPYSVVLFDEIEKAHPDVFNILLQVLDDGRITDSKGRTVDFKNTVIIMTSNAGAQAIVEPKKLGFASREDKSREYEDMKSGVMNEVKRIFKPEFLNRLDEIIVFHQLTDPELKQIATLMLNTVAKRAASQMNIHLTIRESVKKYIVEMGTDRKYGARPLKRAIQNQIEDALSDAILAGQVKEGNKVVLQMKDGKLEFKTA